MTSRKTTPHSHVAAAQPAVAPQGPAVATLPSAAPSPPPQTAPSASTPASPQLVTGVAGANHGTKLDARGVPAIISGLQTYYQPTDTFQVLATGPAAREFSLRCSTAS